MPVPPTTLDSSRAWLAATFAGLTPKRWGIFGLCVLAFALSRPWFQIHPGGRITADPGRLAGAIVLVLLTFTPVLLAVVAAANRGPASGWRRAGLIGFAILVGLVIGKALAEAALPFVLPSNNAIARVLGQSPPPLVLWSRRLSLVVSDAALCVTAVAFWTCLRRDLDAAAALHAEAQHREKTAQESAEARLLVMQAQIEPHFLFNSLASIRSLYDTDEASGRAMLQHLSSYLTASLPILRESHSTVGRELALSTAYLNVQAIRMGPRLTVEVDVPDSLRALAMPPMMLPTLVENAVIHGLAPLPQGGRISIRAHTKGDRLVLAVDDTGRGLHDTWGAGVGLSNIRARLESEFGDDARLRLDGKADGGVRATLEMPLAASVAAALVLAA